MGIRPEWRRDLYNRFPECFCESPPAHQTQFDMVVIDGTQAVALCRSSKVVESGHDLCRILKHTVDHYQDVARQLVVMTLDTPGYVPRNKERRDDDSKCILGPMLYEMLLLDPKGGGRDPWRCVHAGTLPACIGRDTLWRSTITRVQLCRLVTEALMTVHVHADKTLIIDSGIYVTDEHLHETARQMIQEHHYETRSEFEQAALVANLVSSEFLQCFQLFPGGHYNRFDAKKVGESDVKIFQHVADFLVDARTRRRRRREAETTTTSPPPPPPSILICSQDTDILVSALLHVPSYIDEHANEIDLELWIDSRAPLGKDVMPYRYVNVVALWRAMMRFFHSEFPHVVHPVETWASLMFSVKCDYVEAWPRALKIGPATVWNAFAVAHATDPVTKGWPAFTGARIDPERRHRRRHAKVYNRNGDLVAVNSQKRQQQQLLLPGSLRHVLVHAVRINHALYDPHRPYSIWLDTQVWSKFFFWLCHNSLYSYMRALNLNGWRLDYFGENLQNIALVLQNTLNRLIAQRESANGETVTRFTEPSLKAIGGQPLLPDTKALQRLTVCGHRYHDYMMIPSNAAMLARLRRLQWSINYYSNGWKDVNIPFNRNFAETARNSGSFRRRHDDQLLSIPIWGWRLVDVTHRPETNPTNQYLYRVYCREEEGGGGEEPDAKRRKTTATTTTTTTNTELVVYRYYRVESVDRVYNQDLDTGFYGLLSLTEHECKSKKRKRPCST